MKRNPDLKTPWSESGTQLLHYPDTLLHPNMQWRGNDIFKAKLKLSGTSRGRSAAYFRWEALEADQPIDPGTELPMFITDVGHIVMQGMPQPGGVVEGEFFVVKRGQNYGIRPVDLPAAQDGATEDTGAPASS